MKRYSVLAGAAVVGMLAAAATLPASAQPGQGRPGHHMKHGGHHGGGMFGLQKLDLTDDQKAQVKELFERHRESAKPLFEEAKQAREELKTALAEPNPDPTRVGQLTLAVDAVRDRMKAHRGELEQQISAVLTTEQRAQWQEMKAEREQRRGKMKDRRKDGRSSGF